MPAARLIDDSPLAHLVGYATSRVAQEMRKVFARHVGPLGLTAAEFSILTLAAANGDMNQKELGQALDISAPNLAVTLDRLAERGWVERVRSRHDRRAQCIHLTAAGEQLARRAAKLAETMEEPALAVLTRAERALLIELLHKLVDAGRSAAVPVRRRTRAAGTSLAVTAHEHAAASARRTSP